MANVKGIPSVNGSKDIRCILSGPDMFVGKRGRSIAQLRFCTNTLEQKHDTRYAKKKEAPQTVFARLLRCVPAATCSLPRPRQRVPHCPRQQDKNLCWTPKDHSNRVTASKLSIALRPSRHVPASAAAARTWQAQATRQSPLLDTKGSDSSGATNINHSAEQSTPDNTFCC